MKKLTHLPATASAQDMTAVIVRDGAVIIENVISQQ